MHTLNFISALYMQNFVSYLSLLSTYKNLSVQLSAHLERLSRMLLSSLKYALAALAYPRLSQTPRPSVSLHHKEHWSEFLLCVLLGPMLEFLGVLTQGQDCGPKGMWKLHLLCYVRLLIRGYSRNCLPRCKCVSTMPTSPSL